MKRMMGMGGVALAVVALSGTSCDSPTVPGGRIEGFATSADGTRLKWYLDLPPGAAPFPAVVYATGSGNVSATWSTTLNHAWRLNQLGFAALRYDKRGTGDSGGTLRSLSVENSIAIIEEMATDVEAVLLELLARPEIDPRSVGLFGLSQATWYLPAVASRSDAVRFVGVISGGVASVGTNLRYEQLTQYQVDRIDQAQRDLEDFDGPHGFDPLPFVRDSELPFLYMIGTRDPNSPLAVNADLIESLASLGRDVRLNVYEAAGHGLQEVDFWPDVAEWLAQIGF